MSDTTGFATFSSMPSAETSVRLADLNRRMDAVQGAIQELLIKARTHQSTATDPFGNPLSGDDRLRLASQIDRLNTLNIEAYRYRARADVEKLDATFSRLREAFYDLATTVRNLGTTAAPTPAPTPSPTRTRSSGSTTSATSSPTAASITPAVEHTGTNSNTWLWVLGGVSVLALGAGIYFAMKKGKRR